MDVVTFIVPARPFAFLTFCNLCDPNSGFKWGVLAAKKETAVGALNFLRPAFTVDEPRRMSGRLPSHIHIYVDASYDPDGFSGIGGICFDSCGKVLRQNFLKIIRIRDKDTTIMELEMIANSIAAHMWKPQARSLSGPAFSNAAPPIQ